MLATPASPSARHDVKTCIDLCGQHNNAQLVVDAGDDNSYPGSGQTLYDVSRAGGASADFHFGSGSGSSSDDPTFSGVAGRRSKDEFFSFDGGDFFEYKSATSPSWFQDIHKTAEQLCHLSVVSLSATITANVSLFGNSHSSTAFGISFVDILSSTGKLRTVFSYGPAADGTAGSLSSAGPDISALIENGAVGVLSFCGAPHTSDSYSIITNGAVSESGPITARAVTPESSGSTMHVGANGDPANGGTPAPSGTSIHAIVIWQDRRLANAEMSAVHYAMLGKYG
jgi:hypothetical protein